MAMSVYCRWFFLIVVIYFLSVAPVGALVDHDPIVVNGDAGFAAGGFPGSGAVDDPYRIEGYRIVTSALQRNGVEVHDTSAYFVVRDCVIEADYIGVLVEGAAPGTASVVGNVITGGGQDGGGVSLGCDGVRVINNTCSGFVIGVHTNYADDCEIAYNNFSYNVYHGVNLRYSSDCVVAHNTIVGNGAHGVFIIRDSTGNLVYNNTVAGNSAMKSYEWDNFYSFTVKSQGLDEGNGNLWYDESGLGNRWSDYDGDGDYLIDGSAGLVDKYPVAVEAPFVEPPGSGGGIPGFEARSVILGAALVSFVLWLSRKPYP